VHWPHFTPKKTSHYSFPLEAEWTQKLFHASGVCTITFHIRHCSDLINHNITSNPFLYCTFYITTLVPSNVGKHLCLKCHTSVNFIIRCCTFSSANGSQTLNDSDIFSITQVYLHPFFFHFFRSFDCFTFLNCPDNAWQQLLLSSKWCSSYTAMTTLLWHLRLFSVWDHLLIIIPKI
jgi:hypothetical protein